ncbi:MULTISPECIES: hypothetical protein [unclassified Providencia]|uniref:hypothetical protein n=1 Tax=unclassified Providencia TaxID=2633465 RepID=UPI0023494489|nr:MULTISPECIES: hypothetical protein [unclassified Providencia]
MNSNNDAVATIKINNIDVGSMPLSQYEDIVRSVKKDYRIKVATTISGTKYIFKIANYIYSYFAKSIITLITLIMLCSLFFPNDLTSVITELKTLSPDEITGVLSAIASICILLTMLVILVSFFSKGVITSVYVSPSEIAINNKIREIMEVPAEGQVTVTFSKII